MKKLSILLMLVLVMILSTNLSVFAANGLTTDEWRDYYKTLGNNETGMHMFADASYKTPLNPNYVKVDMNIEKLADQPADAWISMGLVNTSDYALSPTNNDPAGLCFMLKNRGGKLNLSCYSTGFGKAYFENTQLDVSATGTDLSFEFVRDDANSTWNLLLNGKNVNTDDKTFKDLKASDFTDSNNKTYVAFAAYDNQNDALNNRVWTILKVTDVSPNASASTTPTSTTTQESTSTPVSNPKTSDDFPMGVAILGLAGSLLLSLMFVKKIKTSKV